jgi:SAM-dependent methyltransferase
MDTVRVGVDVALPAEQAFARIVEELVAGLARLRIRFECSPEGRVFERGRAIGRVAAWESDRRIALEWHPADWRPELVTHVALRFEPVDGGSHVTLECRGLGLLLGDSCEILGWFARELAAPLLRATTSEALGDWLTDRWARRPTGVQASARYRGPVYHYPGFRVLLTELALRSDDCLLDVGCGGGAFLKDALRSGCWAAAVDHSPEMVAVARDANRDAVAEGRLTVVAASGNLLPFVNDTFTCASMHGMLGFLADPVQVLAEIRRVLRPGGRLVLSGTDPELKGTPACPEPIASRLRFYDDADLSDLAREAGFGWEGVLRRNLEDVAREVGIPEDELAIFAHHDARFLVARKTAVAEAMAGAAQRSN